MSVNVPLKHGKRLLIVCFSIIATLRCWSLTPENSLVSIYKVT